MRRLFHHNASNQIFITSIIIESMRGHRNVYAYGSYPTPSKGNVGLLPNHASVLDWVNKYEDNIMYHAQWRVILYFLLLVAYHNQKRIIQIDSTELQHGVGIAPHLQACHTSLFPSLIDHSILDAHNIQRTSIIDNSFMNHWNNMTVTCPVISNRYDTFLEGRGSGSALRKELLFILNTCSFGGCTPLIGLKIFFMHTSFSLAQQKWFINRFDSTDEKRAAQRVCFLQRKGMLSLASPIHHSPNIAFFGKILELDKARPYAKTQKILLTGGKKEAAEFLKQFKL